jgi:hypothetical protein
LYLKPAILVFVLIEFTSANNNHLFTVKRGGRIRLERGWSTIPLLEPKMGLFEGVFWESIGGELTIIYPLLKMFGYLTF